MRIADLTSTVVASVLEMAMTPREAFFAANQAVGIAEAAGRIAAEAITPYPPGIPVVMPGEVLDARVLELVAVTHAAGNPISAADPSLRTIRVVR